MSDKKAGDEHLGQWVYCKQHVGPHSTGWCTVTVNEKVGLDASTFEEAVAECRRLGLHLWSGREWK